MKDKIKAAFDEVTAEKALQENTEAFVLRYMAERAPSKAPAYQPLLAAFACFLLVIAGGCWSIFTPTAEITIDINPSMVLNVNRFDRVISLDSYNSDGADLVRSLDVKFLKYPEAVDRIMANETVSNLLSQDEMMTIAVTGQNAQQSEEIVSNLQSYTNIQESVYCYYAESEEAAHAHHMGLSHPRYQAYLTLLEQGKVIDPEELNHMSMREIQDLLGEASDETTCESSESTSGNSSHHDQETNGHNGNQYGYGNSSHSDNQHDDDDGSHSSNQHDDDSSSHSSSGNGNQHGHSSGQHH